MRPSPKQPSGVQLNMLEKLTDYNSLVQKGDQHSFLGRKDSFMEKTEKATKTIRKKTDLGRKVQDIWKETIKLRTSNK